MGFDSSVFTFWNLYGAALVGLAVTFLLVAITEYYTGRAGGRSNRSRQPRAPATRPTSSKGSPSGCSRRAAPVVVIAAGILIAYKVAGGGSNGLYGIGVAVMAQLSMTGLIVALDAYGPVTDNAGGIAEMAELDESVRAITDPLDAVGNTTKAVTKGYAIGSAALAALVLFDSYTHGLIRPGAHGDLRPERRLGDRGPVHRRTDAVPVRVFGDDGSRPRGRPGGD